MVITYFDPQEPYCPGCNDEGVECSLGAGCRWSTVTDTENESPNAAPSEAPDVNYEAEGVIRHLKHALAAPQDPEGKWDIPANYRWLTYTTPFLGIEMAFPEQLIRVRETMRPLMEAQIAAVEAYMARKKTAMYAHLNAVAKEQGIEVPDPTQVVSAMTLDVFEKAYADFERDYVPPKVDSDCPLIDIHGEPVKVEVTTSTPGSTEDGSLFFQTGREAGRQEILADLMKCLIEFGDDDGPGYLADRLRTLAKEENGGN